VTTQIQVDDLPARPNQGGGGLGPDLSGLTAAMEQKDQGVIR
jgi:hypothetical protein